jgi:hypothetical protein
MSVNIVGSWNLAAWRRFEGDAVSYPLGEDAIGLLIYASDLRMAVQMMSTNRGAMATKDALGGDPAEQAKAYSTCLAYFGSYQVQGDDVVHRVEGSLFPNWSGTVQTRPFTCKADELVLRTPPAMGPAGTLVNEMSWFREDPGRSE